MKSSDYVKLKRTFELQLVEPQILSQYAPLHISRLEYIKLFTVNPIPFFVENAKFMRRTDLPDIDEMFVKLVRSNIKRGNIDKVLLWMNYKNFLAKILESFSRRVPVSSSLYDIQVKAQAKFTRVDRLIFDNFPELVLIMT